jgi:hypothetical protein
VLPLEHEELEGDTENVRTAVVETVYEPVTVLHAEKELESVGVELMHDDEVKELVTEGDCDGEKVADALPEKDEHAVGLLVDVAERQRVGEPVAVKEKLGDVVGEPERDALDEAVKAEEGEPEQLAEPEELEQCVEVAEVTLEKVTVTQAE